MTFGFFVAA